MKKAELLVATTTTTPPPPREPRWRQALALMIEVLVGTAVFIVLAGTAVLLNQGVGYLDTMGIDGLLRIGLKTAEYALFGVDLALYLRFLWDVWRNQ